MATSETLSASANAPPRHEPDPGRVRNLTWLRHGLWVFVLAAGAGAVAMTVANEGVDGIGTPNGLKFLIGLAFAGSGLYAWGRRPENRLGPLMIVVGSTYLLAQILIQAHASPLFTAGIWLSDAWAVVFVVFLLSFPDGRLTARLDPVVVGLFALMAFPLELLWLLFFTTGGSPENALVVWPNDGVAGNVDSAQRALTVLASVVLAIVLARRWLLASPPLRRALVPILVGSVGILLGSVLVALDKFQIEFPTARWAVFVVYVAIPLVVLGGILRSRLARSTVGDLFVELRADPSPGELRDALARALRDPSLTLAYWLPQFRSWSRPRRPARAAAGRGGDRAATTLIDRDGEHVAALVHDPALLDEPELLDAVSAAAGIALENGRLHVELRARLEELRGSRSRIDRGGAEGAAAIGAQPPRRRPAAADRALARAEPARAGAGSRRRRRHCASRRRGARSRRRSESCARSRAGFIRPSSAATGSRSRSSSSTARAPVPVRLTVAIDGPPPGAGRGRRLLPRLGEPRQRREARAAPRPPPSTSAGRTGRSWSRSSTTGSAGPTPSAARDCAASPIASRRSKAGFASGARAAAEHGSGRRSRARRDRRGQRPAARGAHAAPGEARARGGGQLRDRRRPAAEGAQLLARCRDRRHPAAADAQRRGPARGPRDPRRAIRRWACSCSRSTSRWASR